jgi:hypothetical protein
MKEGYDGSTGTTLTATVKKYGELSRDENEKFSLL